MFRGGIERKALFRQAGWVDSDFAPQRPGNGRTPLVDFDLERRSVPTHDARTDGKPIRTSRHLPCATLGHRPATDAASVESHVERAMIDGSGASAAQRMGVVRRENAADECNYGESVLAVVAQRIDIPPLIAAVRQNAVEPQSARSAAAASRPEVAAIGNPGPG